MLFTYQPEEYTRQIDLIPAYIQDAATYLSRTTGRTYDHCLAYVKATISPKGVRPLKDPDVMYLSRAKNGDRAKRTCSLSEYLKFADEHQLILAPTFTAYLNSKQRPSHLAEYIIDNMRGRKVQKKLMFKSKMAGQAAKAVFHDNLQASLKIKNNSMSGAHSSPSTPLYNKSSHSTLTSTCRISTSYANANNECFLAGNRHYWTPQVVLTHLLNSVRHAELDRVEVAMTQWGLHYPTVQDVMDCIEYSTSLYWTNTAAMAEIRNFVEHITPIERAAFVYNSDLYHLALHNPEFTKQMLVQLATVATEPVANAQSVIDSTEGELLTMVSLLCSDLLDGGTLQTLATTNPTGLGIVAATALRVQSVLDTYTPLIHGFWRPTILPPSIAMLPNIIRRAVVTSDTDSTIFTNQHWTDWVTGGDNFTPLAYRIGYTTTYLTSQLVKHKLALMSANIGAIPEHIHSISMKNEYYFPVFSLTSQAKHYYAYRSAQEGNVFKHLETEIKGVHLRDSTAPPEVTALVKSYIESIMTLLMTKGKLTIDDVLGPIASLEQSIIDNILNGGYNFMKGMQIKGIESYVQGAMAANYQHYCFWDEVLGPKYGVAPVPPFQAIKVSVDLSNKSKIQQWIAGMADRAQADRFEAWITRTGKTNITTFVLPLTNLQTTGIPKEITAAIDLRKLVKNISSPFYLLLESLGIYMSNDKITRLVSDTYIPNPS